MTRCKKWTLGPWPINFTGDGKRIVVGEGLVEGPNGYEVCEVYADDCPREVAEANANLIAAAPDLYEALVDLRARFHRACLAAASDVEFVEGSTPDADAALAKARGETSHA